MKRFYFYISVIASLVSCTGNSTIDKALQAECQAICDELAADTSAIQFCVYRDGKCVVDVCSGRLSKEEGAREIDKSDLFAIFSTEKPLLSTAVHRAVEMGLMDYDKPLNTWWPEFTGDGKDSLTLRLTMAYRSGMNRRPDVALFPSLEDCADWDKVVAWAATAKPDVAPGTIQKYMPLSYGWMLGHPLEVAYGKPIKEALDELVLIPAEIQDEFFFATGDAEQSRLVTGYGKTISQMNGDIFRRTCMPSAWGVASARSIARFYNRLCGYDGEAPLVSKETLDNAVQLCRADYDPLPETIREKHCMVFGLGYGLWGEPDGLSAVFGHGGAGGSGAGLVNREQKMVIGYTCNDEAISNTARNRLLQAVGFEWRYSEYPDALL